VHLVGCDAPIFQGELAIWIILYVSLSLATRFRIGSGGGRSNGSEPYRAFKINADCCDISVRRCRFPRTIAMAGTTMASTAGLGRLDFLARLLERSTARC